MQANRLLVCTFVAVAAATASRPAQAVDAASCGHPALARTTTCAAPVGIDPNTFLVQPPASTRWVVRQSSQNGEHPAVVAARLQRHAGVDANTFFVQPPAAVQWKVQEAPTWLATAPATRAN